MSCWTNCAIIQYAINFQRSQHHRQSIAYRVTHMNENRKYSPVEIYDDFLNMISDLESRYGDRCSDAILKRLSDAKARAEKKKAQIEQREMDRTSVPSIEDLINSFSETEAEMAKRISESKGKKSNAYLQWLSEEREWAAEKKAQLEQLKSRLLRPGGSDE